MEGQTAIHSPNYPQFYSNDCVLRWVVYAPRGHVVKVTHQIFQWSTNTRLRNVFQTNLCHCRVVFQLDFADFSLEESDRCAYDSLTVLGDVEGRDVIGRMGGSPGCFPPLSHLIFVGLCSFCPPFMSSPSLLHRRFLIEKQVCFALCCVAVLCAGGVPPPVLSYRSVMVLQFTSDSSITHRGFSATLTFISHTGVSTVCVWCLGLIVPWWSKSDFVFRF